MKTFGLISILILVLIEILVSGAIIYFLGNRVDYIDWLIGVGGLILLQAILTFNIMRVDDERIYLLYLFNPFKRRHSILLNDVESVSIVNSSILGGNAKIKIITAHGEKEFSMLVLKNELKKMYRELTEKGVKADLSFF
jgi:hypothetical protein